jgi:hypothetical protein
MIAASTGIMEMDGCHEKIIVIGILFFIGLVSAGTWEAPSPDAARLIFKSGDCYFYPPGKTGLCLRPVNASLAGDPHWSVFEQSPDLEILQIHPYGADLDLMLLSQVSAKLDRFQKPVLIGEAGLSAAGPESAEGAITTGAKAEAGVRHAVWAAIVSRSHERPEPLVGRFLRGLQPHGRVSIRGEI